MWGKHYRDHLGGTGKKDNDGPKYDRRPDQLNKQVLDMVSLLILDNNSDIFVEKVGLYYH